ncbi:HAD family phosphatase [Francisella sp. Scap27]|uniref:HAD family hydrolase n=1 Tax=Francisella sp. Scap27 TaxID=2589986 RepID=UPI0015BB66D3|nr:HAD family phosphatase [Francisella sp. Scap27]QLE78283.1 HAD family phosphatase [Francisella sp. Scap27]
MLLPIHKDTKLLIFDCDGTIINNMSAHIEAWGKVLTKHSLDLPLSDLSRFHGLPSEYILAHLYPHKKESFETIAYELKETTYGLLHKSEPIQPVVDLIEKYRGKIPMVVISGGKRKNVLRSLDILKITDYFAEIITADDNHPTKNTTDAFTLLAKKYKVEPKQCHVFEDGVTGLINALEAGMTVTDVRNIEL